MVFPLTVYSVFPFIPRESGVIEDSISGDFDNFSEGKVWALNCYMSCRQPNVRVVNNIVCFSGNNLKKEFLPY